MKKIKQVFSGSKKEVFTKVFKFTCITILILYAVSPFLIAESREMIFPEKRKVSYEEVVDADALYQMTGEEIKEIFGEPTVEKYGLYRYDMGDYELRFHFYNMHLSTLCYEPAEAIPYKSERSLKKFFEIVGLKDRFTEFSDIRDGYSYMRYHNPNSKDISTVIINKSLRGDSVEQIYVYFNKYIPETKVFEYDFSEVVVVEDVVSYIDKSKDDVYADYGEPENKYFMQPPWEYGETWVYHTELGIVSFDFNANGVVNGAEVYDIEIPLNYEKSPQEILVMFGIDPQSQGIVLTEIELFRQGFENIVIGNNVYTCYVSFDEETKQVGRFKIYQPNEEIDWEK